MGRYGATALVLAIAVLLGSGLYTGIIPNALHTSNSASNQQPQISTTGGLTEEQTTTLTTGQATPIENLALGPNPSTLVVQLTDPPTVPAGTTSLNLTYSAINLVVAVPASKDGKVTPQMVAVTPQGGSVTLDLLRLQNVSQTIAAANLPNGTTIYSIGFTVAGVSIAVNGTVSAVALATGANTLQVTLAKSSPLYGTNAFLVELNPTVVDTPTGYQMIPSAVGILKTQSAPSGSSDEVGSKQPVSDKDKENLDNAKGKVAASVVALSVSGNVTTLTVRINNTGDGPVRLEGVGLAGNFTLVGSPQACTNPPPRTTTTYSQTSSSTTRPPSTAYSRLGFTNITVANAPSGYAYGKGEGGYAVTGGNIYFSVAFIGQRPNTHFSLVLSINGTAKSIGDYTTDANGVGKVGVSTALGNGRFVLGLTILDDSTFSQPTPVLASNPATFKVLTYGPTTTVASTSSVTTSATTTTSSTVKSTSTTTHTSSTTTYTQPQAKLYYRLVQVAPTSAAGGNASGYAGISVSGQSLGIAWYVTGALPGRQLQMVMKVNASGGATKSFPFAPVTVGTQGTTESQATVSLDYGTYSIGVVVVDPIATTGNATVLTSVPASSKVAIQSVTTTQTTTATTTTTSTTSKGGAEQNSGNSSSTSKSSSTITASTTTTTTLTGTSSTTTSKPATTTTTTRSYTTKTTTVTHSSSDYKSANDDGSPYGYYCKGASGLILVPIMPSTTAASSTSSVATSQTTTSTTASSTGSTTTATASKPCSQGKLALVQDGQTTADRGDGNVIGAGQCVELTFTGQITFGHAITIVPSTVAGQAYLLGVLGSSESVMTKCVLPVSTASCTEVEHP